MHTKSILLTTSLLLTSILATTSTTPPSTATTTPTPAQSTQIANDLLSYISVSLISNPSAYTILAQVGGIAGTSLLVSLLDASPTATLGLAQAATDPAALLRAEDTAWESVLPTSLRSAFDGLRTQIVEAEASIIRHDLGISGAVGMGQGAWVGAVVAVGVVAGGMLVL